MLNATFAARAGELAAGAADIAAPRSPHQRRDALGRQPRDEGGDAVGRRGAERRIGPVVAGDDVHATSDATNVLGYEVRILEPIVIPIEQDVLEQDTTTRWQVST